MENYNIIETIGDGTYGVVYKALNIMNNEYVAIKKMKKNYTNWDECLELKEVKALVGLKHNNIVTMNELILKDEELCMIFEYVGQNLYEYSIKTGKELNEIKIRNIIYQILQGLSYMHKKSFFHRDMKPENILINEDIVKIADFGLAKEITSSPPFTEYVSTRWYRSPEVILKCTKYNSPIDIFAVGAIMAELYMNKPLFPGKNEYDQMNKICEILGTPLQNDWIEGYNLSNKINYKFPSCKGISLNTAVNRANSKAIDLMEKMLNFNPLKRPSASECLQHPFFQCYDILTLYGLNINSNNLQRDKQVLSMLSNPMKISSKNSHSSISMGFLPVGQNSSSSLNYHTKNDNSISVNKNKENKKSNKSQKYKFDDFFNLK